jgi:pterin-4a-carbinolamine dehydratase
MKEYLTESTQDEIQRSLFGKINVELPVEVEKKPVWETLENPPRLRRKFKLENSNQAIQFLYEIIQYENDVQHNGSILIEGMEVTVEVYTHSVEEITELDIEYANELSKIYRDVKDYEQQK